MILGPYRPIAFAATAADVSPWSGAAILGGWSLTETAGAAASLQIINGAAADGAVVVDVPLTANGTDKFAVTGGLFLSVGVTVHRVAGTFRGTLWVLPVEEIGSLSLVQGDRAIWSGVE